MKTLDPIQSLRPGQTFVTFYAFKISQTAAMHLSSPFSGALFRRPRVNFFGHNFRDPLGPFLVFFHTDRNSHDIKKLDLAGISKVIKFLHGGVL